MKLPLTATYAFRSLVRHTRRTILSVVGIGLGCGVCLFMVSFVRGESETIMRAAAESGAGHLRVVPEGWEQTRENELRLPECEATLDRVRAMPAIHVATPRSRTGGLLAFGTRVTGVELTGVDPLTEPQVNRLIRNVIAGEYLKPGDEGAAVIGQTIARRLDVEVDDDLMLTVTAKDGEMKGAMLRVAGIVSTGSRELDTTICHITLEDLESLTGYSGAAEVTIIVKDEDEIPSLQKTIAATLPPGGRIITWKEIMPELASAVEVDKTWTRIMVGMVVLVVFLGIASAQLAAVLERRREFAVLAALGLKSGRLVVVMLLEGFVLGAFGATCGLLVGAGSAYYIATRGIDFTRWIEDSDMSFSNILLDPVIYGDFGWWLAPLAFGLALTASMLSSVYPAWFAVRTDPAAALRVEQ